MENGTKVLKDRMFEAVYINIEKFFEARCILHYRPYPRKAKTRRGKKHRTPQTKNPEAYCAPGFALR
jgi:hypothetical protein